MREAYVGHDAPGTAYELPLTPDGNWTPRPSTT